MKKIYGTVFLSFICIFMNVNAVMATGTFSVSAKCEEANTSTIVILANEADFDGFDIYRSDSLNGDYVLAGTVETDYYYDDYYNYYDYDDSEYIFTDRNLEQYKTYYYQVKAYKMINEQKSYLSTMNTNVMILAAGPSITEGKRTGKNGAKLSWTLSEDADGYYIYMVKDYDDKDNYIYVDLTDFSQYTLLKDVTNKYQLNATFKKLTNGVTYSYYVVSYKNINGVRVSSIPSDIKSVVMDYYAYAGESYNQKVKRAFGSEKAKKKNFKSAAKAAKQMTTIKIKVWDFKSGKKGKKITKIKSITVNKNLAPTIKQIFSEIYKSKEKQVIHEIGCYGYREGEHMYGMAIDVNWTENYMIDGKKILCGKYWKPKKDPYSIPNNSEFVKIMNRYGFTRGAWGKRKDYMHFSFFGK